MHMLRGRCDACGWEYDIIVLPMPLAIAAQAMAAPHCPICGNRAGNTVTAPRSLTEDERIHKAAVMAHQIGQRPPGVDTSTATPTPAEQPESTK